MNFALYTIFADDYKPHSNAKTDDLDTVPSNFIFVVLLACIKHLNILLGFFSIAYIFLMHTRTVMYVITPSFLFNKGRKNIKIRTCIKGIG